jgi:hypothetical protein
MTVSHLFGTELNRTFNLNGFALIVSSFLSFAVYHANPKVHPNQWQWLMVIESILSFFVFVLFYFFFPDNPTTASFLTQEEKIIAIKRVQANQNGIETKVWKKHQYVRLPAFLIRTPGLCPCLVIDRLPRGADLTTLILLQCQVHRGHNGPQELAFLPLCRHFQPAERH